MKTSIEHLLKGISHESQDVRQLAVTKLQDLLHSNQVCCEMSGLVVVEN